MMGSLQQSVWTKGMGFPAKGYGNNSGFVSEVKFWNMKPCKASPVEGSLVTGKPSSLSFSVPEIGGNWYFLFHLKLLRVLLYSIGSFSLYLWVFDLIRYFCSSLIFGMAGCWNWPSVYFNNQVMYVCIWDSRVEQISFTIINSSGLWNVCFYLIFSVLMFSILSWFKYTGNWMYG